MNNEPLTTASRRNVRSSSFSNGSSPSSLQSRRPSYRPVQQQPPPSPSSFALNDDDEDVKSRTLPKVNRRSSNLVQSNESSTPRPLYLLIIALIALLLTWILFFRSSSTRTPLRIPSRIYETQTYQHLNLSLPINIESGTRVFHVTKEFGPATMGGLGVMLTSLAIAQAEAPHISISVILPHYSFLRKTFPTSKLVVNLPIPVIQRGKSTEIGCKVHLLKWKYSNPIDFLNPDVNLDGKHDERSIDIYLVGPGDSSPFNVAFKASDAGDIYTAYKPLKQEWKDLWFAKSTSALITYLNKENGQYLEVHEEVKKALSKKKALIDVVHLHGATNAMVAFFLRQAELLDTSHALPPSIIYSLHDSLDEVEYSNLVSNVITFLDSPSSLPSQITVLKPYIYGDQIFTSAIGVDLANMVTFVSRAIATNIVEGRFKFSLHDLIMPSILSRAKTGSFIGVTNGLDFNDLNKNPFISPSLIQNSISFPRIGKNLLKPDTFWTSEPLVETIKNPLDSSLSAISFVHAKERAKQHLITSLPSLFNPTDLDRPFFLFIGRYQYNKGCQFFEPLLELISTTTSTSSPYYNAKLILLGTQNNFPITQLKTLLRKYPNHLVLITSTEFQSQWGSTIRMASDFSFVPSFSEAFGLIAVEGLAFGMRIVSTGVGGLKEFLVPIDTTSDLNRIESEEVTSIGNSYLFSLTTTEEESSKEIIDYTISAEFSRPSNEELKTSFQNCLISIKAAITDWRKLKEGDWIEREKVVRNLVSTALSLSWNRHGGPVEEYNRVYSLSISNQLKLLLISEPIYKPITKVELAASEHPLPKLPSEIKARMGFHPAPPSNNEAVEGDEKRGRKKKRVPGQGGK